jgi:cell division topological specificity factor
MSLLSFFNRRSSAPIARERLQILLAHERSVQGANNLLSILREEILAVVARHIAVDEEKVQVTVGEGRGVSTLEIDIEVPSMPRARAMLRA